MVHEFTAVAAWTMLAAVSVAGYFGLRMCRAMLRYQTDSDLRREAASSMLKQAKFCSLSTHQRVAVLSVLSAYATPRAGSRPQGLSLGTHISQIRPLVGRPDTFIDAPKTIGN